MTLTTYDLEGMMLVWDIEVTDQFIEWWDTLTAEEQESITDAVNVLEQRGPGLGRPLVDSITSTPTTTLEAERDLLGNFDACVPMLHPLSPSTKTVYKT